MNCTECKEKLAELLEGLLPESQRQTVQEHLKDCQVCRNELAELKELSERLISGGKTWQQTNLEDAVFNQIIRRQSQKLKQADRINRQLRIWRRIMKRPITKIAAVAAIIIVVVLSITLLDKSVTSAYAIEQTIEAFKNVRYMHLVRHNETGQIEDERWVEIGLDGLQARYRQDTTSHDFFVVDDRETVLVHYKDKNTIVLYDPNDQSYTWHYAPGKLFEELANDQLTLTIEENVDYWGRPSHRVRTKHMEFYIDPDTKLPIAGEGYEFSYENPPEGTFDIVIPDDAILVDKRPGAEPAQEPQWMIDAKIDENSDAIAQEKFNEARKALATGEYEKAAELFEYVVEKQPRRNWAWFWLGQAYYKFGDYNAAIYEFSKVIDMLGDAPYCRLARAFAYQAKGMEEMARKDFEVALPIMINALRQIDAGQFDFADDPMRRGGGFLDKDCHATPSKEQSIAMMINRLRIVTGQNFEYDPDASAEDNERAIRAWEDWFKNSGQIQFTPDAKLVRIPASSE